MTPLRETRVAARRSSKGYSCEAYARSLSELGTPVHLTGCGGWLVRRRIPGTVWNDAMGCYPLFACSDWGRLPHDLEHGTRDWVSVTVVADPFGDYDTGLLRRAFPDLVAPFKQHFVVDLRSPSRLPENHARNLRKARAAVSVERCRDPESFGSEWVRLYAALVKRHEIRGIAAFSPATLLSQLSVPGLTMFRACQAGRTVGIVLWFEDGEVGYYHLAAYDDAGYETNASFALFAASIEHLSGRLRWLDLGSGAGLRTGDDGLTRFKRGWATGTRTAYLCGRIVDRRRYSEIADQAHRTAGSYFPLYRQGEFK